MTSTTSVEIKVVYDASKRRGRGTTVRPSPMRPGRRDGRDAMVVALLNLAAAGAMYYATWWRVDPFLYITMVKKTPIDVPADFGSSGFFVSRPARGVGSPSLSGADGRLAEEKPQAESAVKWSGKTAQVVIPAASYGWLALATAGGFALALAGGTGIGTAGGSRIRRIGAILTLGFVAGLGFAVFKVWSEYRMTYKPDHLRIGIGGLTLLFATVGLVVAGRVRGFMRLAAATLILAAVGSAVGMWLWSQCGALEPGQASVMMIALVFMAHSAWGWVLWLLARRTG